MRTLGTRMLRRDEDTQRGDNDIREGQGGLGGMRTLEGAKGGRGGTRTLRKDVDGWEGWGQKK